MNKSSSFYFTLDNSSLSGWYDTGYKVITKLNSFLYLRWMNAVYWWRIRHLT
jgi:hypothetical protein